MYKNIKLGQAYHRVAVGLVLKYIGF